MKINLTFPTVTGNHYKSLNFARKRVFVTKSGQRYRLAIKADLMKADAIKRYDVPLSVKMKIVPPDRRRRDIDNICKTLFDALTLAGLWTDDKLIKKLTVEVVEPTKPGYIEMEIDDVHIPTCS